MAAVIPARYRVLGWVALMFVAVNTATRLGLVFVDGTPLAELGAAGLAQVFATGLVYDAAALTFALLPFALLAVVVPDSPRGRRAHALAASALVVAGLAALLFVAVAEFVFWNEFASRFNFIAVDYLVYTREVVGNVRESYPLGWMLGGIVAAALAAAALLRRPLWRAASAPGGRLRERLLASGAVCLLPFASVVAVGDAPREALGSAAGRELAGNGAYEFVRAFRHNDLDFRAFYRTLPEPLAERELRSEFTLGGHRAVFTGSTHPLERRIESGRPMDRLNVVLVSMESLGADYVQSFGGKPGLTPNLDRLAREGLVFTNLYATGLRTVRGLEALTLSLPPTPGHAVPMRPHNKGFQTLGGVLRDNGYESLYLYGGYSMFDNMRDFFGGNGYTVIDRSTIDATAISHETIWGVADEDLFRLALREIDARAASAKPVFAHVMTTSNHRPFTYPSGRIDIAPGSGRDGAVKYADHAIGVLLREAASRPWFADTLFVFVADHTSHGRGRSDLPPENYRIPAIVWSPKHVKPRAVATLASQIDIAPTVLGLLGASYTSRFFGHDILVDGAAHPRAFMANYLTVGYMQDGLIVELSPKRKLRVVDAATLEAVPADEPRARRVAAEAVAYYQVATALLRAPGATVAASGH